MRNSAWCSAVWLAICGVVLFGCGADGGELADGAVAGERRDAAGEAGAVDADDSDAAAPDAGAPDEGAADTGAPDPVGAAGNELRPEGVGHCYTARSGGLTATTQFWIAFRGGHLEDRAAAIAALQEAASEHPAEEEVALLLGLAQLWRVAEPLPEEESDMTGFITAALEARSELERAYELCPTDHRIPAWLGPILVNQGRALMDDATVQAGLEVLQQGIDHYPSFVLFSKLLVYADRPRDDPDFQNALDAIVENVAVCAPGDPACSNHPHAAHNIEGASVFMGDVFTKAGDEAQARAAYEMAMSAAEYAQWDYQALLHDRLDTLEQRIAAYTDDDQDNDPAAVWTSNYQCSICHKQ